MEFKKPILQTPKPKLEEKVKPNFTSNESDNGLTKEKMSLIFEKPSENRFHQDYKKANPEKYVELTKSSTYQKAEVESTINYGSWIKGIIWIGGIVGLVTLFPKAIEKISTLNNTQVTFPQAATSSVEIVTTIIPLVIGVAIVLKITSTLFSSDF